MRIAWIDFRWVTIWWEEQLLSVSNISMEAPFASPWLVGISGGLWFKQVIQMISNTRPLIEVSRLWFGLDVDMLRSKSTWHGCSWCTSTKEYDCDTVLMEQLCIRLRHEEMWVSDSCSEVLRSKTAVSGILRHVVPSDRTGECSSSFGEWPIWAAISWLETWSMFGLVEAVW